MVRDTYKNGKLIKIAFCAKRIKQGLSFSHIKREASKNNLSLSKATYVAAKTCVKHDRPIAGVTYNYVHKLKPGTLVTRKRKAFPVTKPICREKSDANFKLAAATLRNTVDVLKTIGYSRNKIISLFILEMLGD